MFIRNNSIYNMRCLLLLFLTLIVTALAAENYQDLTDNEFAEFDEFESDEELVTKTLPETVEPSEANDNEEFVPDDEDQDMVIEDSDAEFEHFQDPDEFEGFADSKEEKPNSEQKFTITKVPIHFRANWDSYWLELLMIAGLLVYFLNFATGKSKNTQLANAWYQSHKSLLEDNFSLVGEINSP